jgi:predicted amidophosphoribosyltransferase
MYCPSCQEPRPNRFVVCPECGGKLEATQEEMDQKRWSKENEQKGA